MSDAHEDDHAYDAAAKVFGQTQALPALGIEKELN
jgi:hypothetical protein